MADNVSIPGLGILAASDDDGTAQHQSIKVMAGANGTFRRWLAFESSMFHLVGANSTNQTNVKASAGWVTAIQCGNINAAVRYLKFHNTAGTPTAGAGVVYVCPIPGGATSPGVNISFGDNPLYFSTGIAISLVTGITDADATAVAASEQNINIAYV